MPYAMEWGKGMGISVKTKTQITKVTVTAAVTMQHDSSNVCGTM